MNTPPNQPIHLFIEMQESEAMQQLRNEVRELRELLAAERLKLNRLSERYANEVTLNNELIDLCKRHNVQYRDSLDHIFRDGLV